MANKFYVPGEQRADKVRDLFAAIAPRYDLINDLQSLGLHRYWKRRLLRLAGIQSGTRALDLCCGTGDIAFAMAKAGAQVIGLDFSASMLAVARERRRRPKVKSQPAETQARPRRSSPNPSPGLLSSSVFFARGDALRLPFPDQQFEVVTVSYGLRNLADLRGGLYEMWRVARPGGRLLVLDFGKPDHPLWRAIYFSYLKWCVPSFGRIFCGDADAYAYILESLKHYPAQNGVAALMAEMNCNHVRIVKLLGGIMSINYGEKSAE